jgi:adenylate kinase family enzyme
MITEIVGLAGAGKSTISQTLSQRDPAVWCSFHLQPMQFIPAFLVRAGLSLPSYLRRCRDGNQISWEALMVMVYLEKLHRALSRYKANDSTILFLDQGPVYCLAYLREFGFEGVRDQNLELWWMHMLSEWASTLDVIFWIDAQDTVLLERIHHRSRWHRVKDMSEQKARQFLARYRGTYRQVVSRLTSEGGPRVFRFFTDEEPVDQIVDEIVGVLEPG